jgi:hypothetical protein
MSSPCSARSWKWSSNPSVLRVTERVRHPLDTHFLQRAEIAELRQECTELRQANLSLERQVREGIVSAVCVPFPYHSHHPNEKNAKP